MVERMFLLLAFLTESDQSNATEVDMFMRELIADYPDVVMSILQRLAECIGVTVAGAARLLVAFRRVLREGGPGMHW